MTRNLTQGKPWLLILLFTLPLLIGNLFQQFYNMADAFIVGRTIGVNALAAVGSTGSINFLIMGFLMSFCMGASIITSQRFGAGDMEGVRKSFAVCIILGLMVTAVLMVISILVTRKLLEILQTPDEIINDAYAYIIIIWWGMPACFLFNLLSMAMRAVGDSTTPLYFLVIACIINIILDFVFILLFKMGVAGAGYATVIAQLISGLLCIPVIIKKYEMLKVRADDFKMSGKDLWEHFRVGFPMGFQMSIIAIGSVTVTFALNRLGALALAANTAAQKIDTIANMPINSFGSAITTYAAQNFGAKKYQRIKQGMFQCFTMSSIFSVVMCAVYWIFGDELARFFIGDVPEVTSLSYFWLKVQGSGYIMLSWLFATRQTLQGLGKSMITTNAGLAECVMRIFAALILGSYFGYQGVCFSNILAWGGACVPLTIFIIIEFKKLTRLEGAQKAQALGY
ncbi:MAG: MATE family efflux transporter [Spirochaetaceae bacterium]|jgi:putative MATE family efflux protein|nr:MATE family efflux transporter [Spirochaetaceae bacterium]